MIGVRELSSGKEFLDHRSLLKKSISGGLPDSLPVVESPTVVVHSGAGEEELDSSDSEESMAQDEIDAVNVTLFSGSPDDDASEFEAPYEPVVSAEENVNAGPQFRETRSGRKFPLSYM